MKKFTKLFLSCAAVAAVTAAVATSAMAADITGDFTGTFDETAKTVTISTSAADLGADETKDMTFLVFKGTDATAVNDAAVEGIDQGKSVTPTNNGLKNDVVAPAEGQDTYTVMIGFYQKSDNTFTTKKATFKLGTSAGEEFKLGEVDGDASKLSTNDATCVLGAALGDTTGIGTSNDEVTLTDAITVDGVGTLAVGAKIKLGEVDGDASKLSTNDATCVLGAALGDTTGIGYAGKTVTATAE